MKKIIIDADAEIDIKLKIADLLIDVSILEKADEASAKLFQNEYILNSKQKEYLKSSVNRLFCSNSIGILN